MDQQNFNEFRQKKRKTFQNPTKEQFSPNNKNFSLNSNRIHCFGDNILENIVWENAGENIVTIKDSGTIILKNCKAFNGSRKLFQINAPCTFKLINVTINKFDNIIRQNGGTKFQVDIHINDCTFIDGKECLAKTDSKLTQLYFDNIKLTQMPIFWKFPTANQIHGRLDSIVYIDDPGSFEGNPVIPEPENPFPKGDVNGDLQINIIDALIIAQKYIGNKPFPFIIPAADVNCDTQIDIIDALLVAQYYVKIITAFSLENCD